MDGKIMMLDLLNQAHKRQASDLHLSVGTPPMMRINGSLVAISESPISIEASESMALSLLDEEQKGSFHSIGEIDFLYELPGVSRFRINVYRQRKYVSAAVRRIALSVPSLMELKLPSVVASFADKNQGLILVTGPTGSGKSSTVAALIDFINRNQSKHIVTLEDPIEYIHTNKNSMINQREVGRDTQTFESGLRSVLRQDPDVIFIGEMRDLETVSAAITAAETGHLVLATLHTSDAVQTIDRIIDAFPGHQQGQIRMQLSAVLVAVISQRLLPTVDGSGRGCATEILVNTPAVGHLIRSEKNHQIKSVMQTSFHLGMRTLEMSIKEMIQSGRIHHSVAKTYMVEGGSSNASVYVPCEEQFR
ncbi:twitching motility protein PilT [Fontibacillus solani]|uniref:Twitching motility protein PilT n=1 Tax=Fontibacillus solani TaxID=1572857 RepID=A0A7W3XQ95_9BACL|nr:type IV pilus twitching motility protein PilT [Fontibacillus solani]MBA9084230.1 twitching motility protein PilT [Fontibacillus solani]